MTNEEKIKEISKLDKKNKIEILKSIFILVLSLWATAIIINMIFNIYIKVDKVFISLIGFTNGLFLGYRFNKHVHNMAIDTKNQIVEILKK